MDVIVDACAAIHAHGMLTKDGTPFLEFIDRALGRPIYGITKAVKTECIRHGMGDWLQVLIDANRLVECANNHKRARAHQATLRKKHKGKAPGTNDAGLLLQAKQAGALLLTDDNNLRLVSLSESIRCGDLFDLCLALRHLGECSTEDITSLFNGLGSATAPYFPDGWSKLRRQGGTWPDALEQLAQTRRSGEFLACGLLGDLRAGR